MKTWKNAVKKASLAVLIAAMAATTILASAGAISNGVASSQHIYTVFGSLNIVLGLGSVYAVILKAQKMDTINTVNNR